MPLISDTRRLRRLVASDLGLALAICGAAAAVSLVFTALQDRSDIDHLLVAARALYRGQDPYPLFGHGPAFGGYPLFYPLPAVILVGPIAWMPAAAARAVFCGVSVGLLAVALRRLGPQRLPVLLAEPIFAAIAVAQWAPLLTAVSVFPALAWLWVAKPNFAFPFLISRPSLRLVLSAAIGSALLLAISLVWVPGWPAEWYAAVRQTASYHPPNYRPLLLSPYGGFLLVAALWRWRDPDARFLFGLACVPQSLWTYNGVPALLLARDRREAWWLVGASWVASAAQDVVLASRLAVDAKADAAIGCMVVLFYLPALWIVLRRPRAKAQDSSGVLGGSAA